MIGHHFSISPFCSASSASGICSLAEGISKPRLVSRVRTAGMARAYLPAALSLSMMSFGVPLGAKSAFQLET
jgi:hypothetical protein